MSLFDAVENNDLNNVRKYVLEPSKDIFETADVLVDIALKNDNIEIIKVLLEAGYTEDIESCLADAIIQGKESIVKVLSKYTVLKGVSLNRVIAKQIIPDVPYELDTDTFLTFCSTENVFPLKAYLKLGIDPNVKSGSALYRVLQRVENNIEHVTALVKAGADLSLKDYISVAISAGCDYKVLELLIQHGAKVLPQHVDAAIKVGYKDPLISILLNNTNILVNPDTFVGACFLKCYSYIEKAFPLLDAKDLPSIYEHVYILPNISELFLTKGYELSFSEFLDTARQGNMLIHLDKFLPKYGQKAIDHIVSEFNTLRGWYTPIALYLINKGYLPKNLKSYNSQIIIALYYAGFDFSGEKIDVDVLYKSHLELTDTEFEDLLNQLGMDISEVLRTPSRYNELVMKAIRIMEDKGINRLTPKMVLDKSSELYPVLGSYSDSKELFKKPVTLTELKSIIDKQVIDKIDVSKNVGYDTSQKYLPYNYSHFALVLNFSRKYLNKIFKIQGSGFEKFYLEYAKEMAYQHAGRITLPIPGKSFGWARIEEISKNQWLISEIQTDFIKLKASISNSGYTEQERMWLQYIKESMLENYEVLIMTAILDNARRMGVKELYMLTPENQTGGIDNITKLRVLYEKTPRKFKFHKVETDLGFGTDKYWYRTARKV